MVELKPRPRVVNTDYEFFLEWLKVIKSYSKLSDGETEYMAALLAKRSELAKVILDEDLLIKNLFDKGVKKEIVEMIGLKDIQTFENLAHGLRKKGVIGTDGKGNHINPRYIPGIANDCRDFSITFRIIKQ